MAKAKVSEKYVRFWCPGCKGYHIVPIAGNYKWDFFGDAERPTLSPSILRRSGHYAPHAKPDGHCWCTYNAEQEKKGEPPAPFKCTVCHSFVRDGCIQFLNDCTHELAGQTVELPDIEIGGDTN
ncbi:MAG: DUF6527 family protein [Sporomusaceae bacterium]|nr:DUF6527 family protein [Sporomusaceae bacterium]